MSLRKVVFTLLSITFISSAIAQTGGTTVFPSLKLDYSAREAGLGGHFITVKDNDINMGVNNPSMLNDTMHQHITFQHAIYVAGINYGSLAYGHSFGKKGTLSAFAKYVGYGQFERTDPLGNVNGTFSAGDFIFGAGYGYKFGKYFSIGANLNFVVSQLESYSSFGMGLDLAATFHHDKSNILLTAMVKNAGVQIKGYTPGNAGTPLPINLMLGFSYRVHKAPFRLSVIFHNLQKWDLSYNDPSILPSIDPLTGETIEPPKANFGEKLMRHINLGLEVFIGKYVHLRTGFNYHRRKEIEVTGRPGIGGLSFGLGLRFKKFHFDYAFAMHSNAGFNNMIGISTNIGAWKKKSAK